MKSSRRRTPRYTWDTTIAAPQRAPQRELLLRLQHAETPPRLALPDMRLHIVTMDLRSAFLNSWPLSAALSTSWVLERRRAIHPEPQTDRETRTEAGPIFDAPGKSDSRYLIREAALALRLPHPARPVLDEEVNSLLGCVCRCSWRPPKHVPVFADSPCPRYAGSRREGGSPCELAARSV
jgi:hypothetical protein